jgi:virulence-associated protein VapD
VHGRSFVAGFENLTISVYLPQEAIDDLQKLAQRQINADR